MNKKRILMISYYFAPENKIGAIRFSKFAKYLILKNYDVTIICSGSIEKVDPILNEDIQGINKIYRIMYSSAYNRISEMFLKVKDNIVGQNASIKGEDSSNLKSKIYLKVRTVYGNLIRRCMDYFIAKKTIKYLKKNYQILNNIDIVFSTYGPLCNHIVAKWIKHKKNDVKWIADFRDAIKNGIFAEESKKSIKIEQDICECADVISIVAEGCVLDKVKKKYYEKIIMLPNGFDKDDVAGLNKKRVHNYCKNKLVIAYTGAMYTKKERDASLLFKAIKQLIDEGNCIKQNIEVVYAGMDFPVFAAQAMAYGLEDVLTDYGFISRDESIKIQYNADILLHLTAFNNASIDLLSGKFFEYIAMNRPIISIIIGRLTGSKIKNIIEEAKLGFCCEESAVYDFEKLRCYIYKKYNEKMTTGQVKSISDKQYISKYDYNNLTDNLIDIIESNK